MPDATERLLRLLTLEPIADEEAANGGQTWRGATGSMAANLSGRLFGGVVIGQAIVAAGRSVPDRTVHTAQLQFLRGGSVDEPVVYRCTPLFEGRTYATWRVEAVQSDELIAHATVGLSAGVEDGPDWYAPAPEAPDLEGAVDRDTLSGRRDPATQPVQTLVDEDQHDDDSPRLTLWARPNGPLPEDPLVHQAVLGYISDRAMLTVARKPHVETHGRLRGATLDHSIWFHRPVIFDRWHRHSMHSSNLGDGRGMTQGALHRDGVLIATTAQQAALRPPTEKQT